MSRFIKQYPGLFIALSQDRKKVLGKGHTPSQALAEAQEKGAPDPILTRIPTESRSYLL